MHIKQIKVISITSYSAYIFHCSVFWITSDFSIHLLHFNSELQTPITFFICERKHQVWVCIFLVRTYFGTTIIWVCYIFSFLHFQHLLFQWVSETFHVAYEKSKIKRKFTFFTVNTKYILSHGIKISEFSLVLHTRESSNVFNTVDEIYLVFTSKR